MLVDPVLPYRPRRRVKAKASALPAAALTLVTASYEDATAVRLTFDRAIRIVGVHGDRVRVDDGLTEGMLYTGAGGAVLESPTRVAFTLVPVGGTSKDTLTLTALAGTGIVALDDGAAWAGVTDLGLPFGE